MRFEELSYRADGLPVTVPFHPRLTVVGPLGGRARAGWIERALGVLLGSRRGDDTSVVFRDHAGAAIRLERDHHGAARIIGLSTGVDVPLAAGDLPLDGRFDWFAFLGLDSVAARALVRIDPSDFKGEEVDPWEVEDELLEARGLLGPVEAEYEAVLARAHQAAELYRLVADLDARLGRLEEDRARRRHGEATQAVRHLEAKAAGLRDAVKYERAAAEGILAAVQAGEEWRRAADTLEVARLAFGDRPPPEPEVSRTPAAPSNGHMIQTGPHAALASELEVAHRAVEEAERQLDRVRMPALAVPARRRLTRAQRQEQAVLNQLGFVSWLAYEMEQVEALLGRPSWATPGARPELDQLAGERATTPADPIRDARLRHTLAEAEAACRAAQHRLAALLTQAGVSVRGDQPAALSAGVSALALRAAEATLQRRSPPTTPILVAVEAELSAARAALAAHGRPDWDGDPPGPDEPLPDPEPLLEEQAHLFEEAYRIERELPDIGRLEDRRMALTRRIHLLEAASQAGYHLRSMADAEMVLLGRVAQARRVGPRSEPIPLVVDDAFAGFDAADRYDLLDLLARLTETTQVVYLTDDPVTLEWAAARAGQGEALVVPPSAIASVA
jgi:hypothetical protein